MRASTLAGQRGGENLLRRDVEAVAPEPLDQHRAGPAGGIGDQPVGNALLPEPGQRVGGAGDGGAAGIEGAVEIQQVGLGVRIAPLYSDS